MYNLIQIYNSSYNTIISEEAFIDQVMASSEFVLEQNESEIFKEMFLALVKHKVKKRFLARQQGSLESILQSHDRKQLLSLFEKLQTV